MSEEVRKRIKDWAAVATTPAEDDYVLLDGATNGTRKMGLKDVLDAKVDAEPGKGLVAIDTTLTTSGKAADAKAVGDKITQIKTDLTGLFEDGFAVNSFAWQKGGMSGGEITLQQYRIVTTNIQTAVEDVVIKNTNPLYKFGVYVTTNNVGKDSGWITNVDNYSFKIPQNSTYRITVAKATENYVTLTDAEVINMSNAIKVSTAIRTAFVEADLNETSAIYGVRGFDPVDFIIGVYYGSGSYYKDTARVCSKSKFQFPFDTKIGVKTGYRIGVNLLDSQGNVTQNIAFGTTEIYIPKNTDFEINIDNGNTSATANVLTYASQAYYYTKIGMDINNLQGVGTYSYIGVNVKPQTHGFNTEQLPWSYSAPTTVGTYTPQAMSYSNGVAFKCWKDNLIQLYNFATGAKIAEYTISSEHGDCMDFSDEYYADGDEFPLAYFTSDTSPLKVYVNRLSRSSGTLIRTLSFPIETAGYYSGHAVDAINNRIITVGYTENSFETNQNGTNFMICSVWDLNDLIQNGDDTYTPKRLKSFTLPFIICTQDQCFYNNKLFIVSSNWQNTNTVLYVVDIGEESIIATFSDIPYKAYETEGIFWVNNDMYVNGNGITKYMFV